MSAPSAFDRYVVRTGVPLPSQRSGQPPRTDGERRSHDPVAALSRQHEQLCRNAADPLEVAAGLEAAGLSDRRVRAAYGVATVFDLAERLYADVPRRPAPAERPSPWSRPRRELWARGLVYALPGLLLVGAVQRLGRAEVLLLLVVSLLTTGVAQALAHLGHVLLGRGARAQAGALLRRALLVVLAAAVAVTVGAVLLDVVGVLGAILTVVVPLYVSGATVVLLLDRHDLLLRLLLPGAVAVLADLALPHGPGAAVQTGATLLGVLGCVVSAWFLATELQATGGRGPGLGRVDVVGALPLLAHGLASMALLSLVPLSALSTATMGGVGPVMLPAVLALGHAEVQLFGFRAKADTLLARHHLRAFSLAVRLDLVRRALTHLAVLAGLTVLVLLVAGRALRADPAGGRHLTTYALLALGLFGASLLVSLGRSATAAALEVGALVLDLVAQALPAPLALVPASAHLVTAAAFATAVLALALLQAGRLVSYR